MKSVKNISEYQILHLQKNPGGVFRNGAQAQEESICRTSSLYLSLTQNRFLE